MFIQIGHGDTDHLNYCLRLHINSHKNNDKNNMALIVNQFTNQLLHSTNN